MTIKIQKTYRKLDRPDEVKGPVEELMPGESVSLYIGEDVTPRRVVVKTDESIGFYREENWRQHRANPIHFEGERKALLQADEITRAGIHGRPFNSLDTYTGVIDIAITYEPKELVPLDPSSARRR